MARGGSSAGVFTAANSSLAGGPLGFVTLLFLPFLAFLTGFLTMPLRAAGASLSNTPMAKTDRMSATNSQARRIPHSLAPRDIRAKSLAQRRSLWVWVAAARQGPRLAPPAPARGRGSAGRQHERGEHVPAGKR